MKPLGKSFLFNEPIFGVVVIICSACVKEMMNVESKGNKIENMR
jgi:hypothetical protein